MESKEFLWMSGERPSNFSGIVTLPPSKSYLHRALFAASLYRGKSKIGGIGGVLSDDIEATIGALSSLGVKITKDHRRPDNLVVESKDRPTAPNKPIWLGASGTTARFLISFCALAEEQGKETTILGDESLSKRPMQPLLDALSSLNVDCYSVNNNGRLPVVVKAGGIIGGRCLVDGSVSSQFLSSLLISCTRAKRNCHLVVSREKEMVSEPYVKATLKLLERFGYVVRVKKTKTGMVEFDIPGDQSPRRKNIYFRVPGDMSSAASIIACAASSHGKVTIRGADRELPQPDLAFLEVARRFGLKIRRKGRSTLKINAKVLEVYRSPKTPLKFNLRHSPDIVPVTAALAVALNINVDLEGIGHLRFKESDRLKALSKELGKLARQAKNGSDSLSVRTRQQKESKFFYSKREPIPLFSWNDHRIFMSLVVAGLSGNFGPLIISDPQCVKKSYPEFVPVMQKLCHDHSILRIEKPRAAPSEISQVSEK